MGRVLRMGVVVFAFRIDQLAKSARLIDLFHGVEIVVERRRLEHSVLQTAILFNAFEQFFALFRLTVMYRNSMAYVLAVLEA